MKQEYDFSNAEQGRFYSEDATHHHPVYLEPEVEAFIAKIAKRKKCDINTVVNLILNKERELVEAVL